MLVTRERANCLKLELVCVENKERETNQIEISMIIIRLQLNRHFQLGVTTKLDGMIIQISFALMLSLDPFNGCN